MSHIDVHRSHALGVPAARRAAEEVLHELREEHGLHLETLWDGDTIHATGRGFEAHVEAGPRHIRVVARLSMFLRPFRKSLEREVHEYLDRFLGDAA
jgi:putative polyhydroxyalkanoate system protein